MPDQKPPKPPKLSASKAEHEKFAKKVLAYEPYKQEPEGGMYPFDAPDEDPGYKPKDPEV